MANKLAHLVIEGTTYDIQDEELTSKFDGLTIELSLSNDYIITATLKDGNNTTLSTATIDLPSENSLVSLDYDNTTNEIIGIYRDDTVAVPHRIRVELDNLQEKLTAGQNISIINNTVSLLGIGEASTETVTGIATLDSYGKVPSSQLPSYVDDVLEYSTLQDFPVTGEAGKIYVTLDTNKTYRWTGSVYVEISQGVVLGETEYTAYRGDRGKIAYDHAIAKGSAYANGLYKITTNSEGHVTSATTVQKSDITVLGIPAQDTQPNNGKLTLLVNNDQSTKVEFTANDNTDKTFNVTQPTYNKAIEIVNNQVSVRYADKQWDISRDSNNKLFINGKFIKQVDDLDTYTDAIDGEIVEFIGTTDTNYTNGYFYKYNTVESITIPANKYYVLLDGIYYLDDGDTVTAYQTGSGNQQFFCTEPPQIGTYIYAPSGVGGFTAQVVTEDDNNYYVKENPNYSYTYTFSKQPYTKNVLTGTNGDYLVDAYYGGTPISTLSGHIISDDVYTGFSNQPIECGTLSEQISIVTKDWERIDVQPNVTKTSDLLNDSDFITHLVSNLTNYYTKSETDAAIGKGAILFQKNGTDITLTGFPTIVDNKTVFGANQTGTTICNITVPTKTSDLTNDGEGDTEEDANHELQPIKFITKLVNNLQYYYTKTEIDALIAPNLRFQVVQSLPTTNISPTTIYLLPNNVGESTNVYDEYIYISTAQTPYWELIGSTRVDMSLYQTIALSSAIVVDGVSQTTVENTLRALNTLLNGHTHSYNELTNKPTIPTITFRQWQTE